MVQGLYPRGQRNRTRLVVDGGHVPAGDAAVTGRAMDAPPPVHMFCS